MWTPGPKRRPWTAGGQVDPTTDWPQSQGKHTSSLTRRAEHCKGTPIILCGFQVTELALIKTKQNTLEGSAACHTQMTEVLHLAPEPPGCRPLTLQDDTWSTEVQPSVAHRGGGGEHAPIRFPSPHLQWTHVFACVVVSEPLEWRGSLNSGFCL